MIADSQNEDRQTPVSWPADEVVRLLIKAVLLSDVGTYGSPFVSVRGCGGPLVTQVCRPHAVKSTSDPREIKSQVSS